MLAERLGVPARFFTAAELETMAPHLANPSELVFRETGCHGVAEGAALAAAGAGAALILEKTKSKRCTMAVSRAPGGTAPALAGRARGRPPPLRPGPRPPPPRPPPP